MTLTEAVNHPNVAQQALAVLAFIREATKNAATQWPARIENGPMLAASVPNFVAWNHVMFVDGDWVAAALRGASAEQLHTLAQQAWADRDRCVFGPTLTLEDGRLTSPTAGTYAQACEHVPGYRERGEWLVRLVRLLAEGAGIQVPDTYTP